MGKSDIIDYLVLDNVYILCLTYTQVHSYSHACFQQMTLSCSMQVYIT